jgi:hypothetical protein
VRVASDGAGGALVVWQDQRNLASGMDLYAQRLLPDGRSAWAMDGLALCTITGWQFEPCLAPDGSGGGYFGWRDARVDRNGDVYANHIDASGSVAAGWLQNGRAVAEGAGEQSGVDLAADGLGNAGIVWLDRRHSYETRVVVQLLTPRASTPIGWPASGRELVVSSHRKDSPRIVADGEGGLHVAWVQRGYGVYAWRLDRIGEASRGWDAPVRVAYSDPVRDLFLVADGTGGFLAGWCRGTSSGSQIWAQHVGPFGHIVEGWPADGEAVAAGPRLQLFAAGTSDGSGGAYFSWVDLRRGDADVFAQQLRGDGSLGPQGVAGGIPVCTAAGIQTAPVVVAEPSGCGALVVWHALQGANAVVQGARLGAQRPSTETKPETTARIVLRGAPNPFVQAAQIQFSLPVSSAVQVTIYDVAGRRIQQWSRDASPAGMQSYDWDGTDAHGAPVAAGTYFVRVRAAGYQADAKLVRSR